ncbi:glycosyltransferase [Actinocrinis puniceicyclus]|uniref:glycosyltransferase n=1 Tax=Actinocrinis puniceicyclus TaxID=977794 RepID=UPI003F689A3B
MVTWNSAKVIDGLLESLRPGLDGLDWQLIVADNDSADDTVARVESWAARNCDAVCRVVHTGGNLGYAAGINAALTKADKYDAALVLNPDIRLHEGSVRSMYEFIDDGEGTAGEPGPRTGIVVPRIVDEEGALAYSLRREPTLLRALGEATLGARAGRFAPLGELVMDEQAYQHPVVADWATGAVMLISAACLAACGPWDESFFLYSEETEFSLRARDRGFLTRLAPRAVATHIGGESRVSPELWTLLMSNRVKLYRRRHALAPSVAYWGAALLREAPRAALGQQRSRSAVKALLSRKMLD